MKAALALGVLALGAGAPAFADIYTWIDGNGVTNVSNLPPPEGVRVQRVTRSAPPDPAREAAFREAARQAELRALDDQVRQLTAELEDVRRGPPSPPVVVVAVPPAYAPPAPYIVNVVAQAVPAAAGCDFGWGNCFGAWPGYFPVAYPAPPSSTWFGKGKGPRRGGGTPGFSYNHGHLIPPLIPRPVHSAPKRPR